MARSLSGNFLGRAARLEVQDAVAMRQDAPDYHTIVIDTFGREYARVIFSFGFDEFKRVSLWLDHLTHAERDIARQLAEVGFDYLQIIAAIEETAMTNQYRETVSTL